MEWIVAVGIMYGLAFFTSEAFQGNKDRTKQVDSRPTGQ